MESETDAMRSRAKHEAIDRYTNPASRQAFIAGAEWALKQREPVAWRYMPSPVWRDYVITEDPKQAEAARNIGCEVTPLYP